MSMSIMDFARLSVASLAATGPYSAFTAQRRLLLRMVGTKLGPTTCLYGGFTLAYPERLTIGDATFVNAGCFFDNIGGVVIGARCFVGPRVVFLTSTHVGPARTLDYAAVTVGDDVWIGACASILPGVRVGDGATVGAGAVVTRDVAAASTVVGVPARAL
jgi:acetyltransferase-like isoleucine patch superfamily enzyme